MQNIEVISLSTASYLIKGDLTFSSITKATIKALNFNQSVPIININLQQVGKIDSAGLALLIEWIRFSRAHQIELRFNNIPTQLTALAKLSYISEIDLFTTK